MSTKKAVKSGYTKGVGQRSKKKSGLVLAQLRIPVADSKLMHKAAQKDKRSFNIWAGLVLLREAEKVLKLYNNIPGDGPTAKAMRAASRGETK
jgi:hypothetical protein